MATLRGSLAYSSGHSSVNTWAPGVVTYSVALSVNVYHVLFTEGGGGGGTPAGPSYTAMMASS